MKKFLRNTLCLILSAAMLLTGCGKQNEDEETGGEQSGEQSREEKEESNKSVALAIIVGNHANANRVDLSKVKAVDVPKLVKRAIQSESEGGKYIVEGKIAVIVNDGNPTKVQLDEMLYKKSSNANMRDKAVQRMAGNLLNYLSSEEIRADDPETNLLKAIGQAQKFLNNYPDDEHHLLIYDTGITTDGPADMRKINIMEGEISELLRNEKLANSLPDLTDTKVTMLGLGNTTEVQGDMPSVTAEDRLEEFWTELIGTAHGKLINTIQISEREGEPMDYSEDDELYPYVSVVKFGEDTEEHIEPDVVNRAEGENQMVVTLSSAELSFKPNSAEFRNLDQATHVMNGLSSCLERVINNTEDKIYVVGSIAQVKPDLVEKNNDVSRDRAKKVADMLVYDYGVPADRVVVVDAGNTRFSWRDAVEFPDGKKENKDRNAMQNNRLVALVSGNAEKEMGELRQSGYVE